MKEENKNKQANNLQEQKPVGKTLLELQAEIRKANKLAYLKKLREQKR